MKKYIIILSVIVYACSSNSKKTAVGLEVIPIEVHKATQNPSSFLEKIELVPLETNDSSLLHRCSKVIYDKGMDLYAIYTREQVVYTFSGDGKYIDNSKRMEGQGPDNYSMVLDISFNPYLKGIDMLNPYGTIYTYTPTFELLARRKFEPEFLIQKMMALDVNNYIFNHSDLVVDQEVLFANLDTQEAVNANYVGTISGNNMGDDCFFHVDENLYFVPFGVNYYIYQIDAKEKKLNPIIYLDFGKSEVKEDGLPGRGRGKRTNTGEERRNIIDELTERYQFLKKSDYILPKIKLINNDYIYIYLVRNDQVYGSHFIYNRRKKEGFLLKEGKPFIMYPCFSIVDNALLTICEPDIVSRVVDRNLMSPEEIQKMEQLNEEDNPVIVKYILEK